MMSKNKLLLTISIGLVLSLGVSSSVLAAEDTSATVESYPAKDSTEVTMRVLTETNDTAGAEEQSSFIEATEIEESTAIVEDATKKVTPANLGKELNFLAIYLKEGYLSQEEYDVALHLLEDAKTAEEITQIMKKVEKDFEVTGGGYYRWAFAESYYNIQAAIEFAISEGSITKEQGEQFLVELNNCISKAELDELWERIEASIPKTTDTTETTLESVSQTSDTSSVAVSQSSTSQESSPTKDSSANKLPQTGEALTNSFYKTSGRALLIISLSLIGFKYRKVLQRNNHK
ncbi:hypothetical protein [Vagococcus salmoninarum]